MLVLVVVHAKPAYDWQELTSEAYRSPFESKSRETGGCSGSAATYMILRSCLSA